jgi:formylglycine-generating enzyme required for sulfatase activity
LAIGSTIVSEKDSMTMVFVPAGEFIMGSESYDDEKPIHKVTLDAYWIDQTEVTNAMYSICVSKGKCTLPKNNYFGLNKIYYGNGEYDNFPVVNVDWKQAKAYCKWAGGDLPTEAQWEKAARGEDGRLYPWGDTSPTCKLLNFDGVNIGSCKGYTTAVKSYESDRSIYGVYDMAGNVLEWVNDWYENSYYSASPTSNPTGPSSGDGRVLRGGSWADTAASARIASRIRNAPGIFNTAYGFRCVMNTDSP